MKIFIIIFFALLSWASFSQTENGWLRGKIKERLIKRQSEKPAPVASLETEKKIEKKGTQAFKFDFEGQTRYYLVHLPQKYDEKTLTPVVFSFHGGGGDMSIQANDEYYHLISKAEKENFILVVPNGTSAFASGKFATWNAGKCCGDARDKKSNDVQFIKNIIDKLKKQVQVDPQKIFAMGMSNGGMMAYRLACEAPDFFKAVASVAGTDNTESCSPTRAISIMHIHAQDDDRVLFNGGAGKFSNQSKVTNFTSVPATIKKWLDLNKCSPLSKVTLKNDEVRCELYQNCQDKTEIKLCITQSGGHSWPGGKKPLGGEGLKGISATDAIWDFFKSK